MGLLHFRRADAQYPGNKIGLTMNDECSYMADIRGTREIPSWIQETRINEAPPPELQFYICLKTILFRGVINGEPIRRNHNDLKHTPRSASIHIKSFFFFSDFFITDGTFEAYAPEHLRSWFPTSSVPARNHIYITVPGGKKYRAHLKPQFFTKSKNRISNLWPAMVDRTHQNTSPPHPNHGEFSNAVASTTKV
ncbi:uncharacterized protein LOC117170100 [Belonocnema kinseyi]|uniref:uncharacterized protein LOC117170100 n=1 Tax=Belonocnema kinseyi TaxID=2817044 RepID=UPI00143DDC03|nr:uncharacterized protein LOC117170100 [Belonocnema kinseyi]